MRDRIRWGTEAGLLAGIAVAGVFFVGDLVHLEPLSTPAAMGRTFLGPGGTALSGSMPDGAVAGVAWAANLTAFTILHLLTFALLGAVAVVLFNTFGWSLNVTTGALYGLVVCTTVLYLSVALVGARFVAVGLPSVGAVLGANLLAGCVLGGGVRLMREDQPSR